MASVRVHVLLVLCFWVASVDVWANNNLDAAVTAYEDGDFDLALIRLSEAERDPNLSSTDLARLHWFRAVSYLATGKKAEGEAAMDRLLRLQPLYEPSKLEASPAMYAIFNQRREIYRKTQGVSLEQPILNDGRFTVGLAGKAEQVVSVVVFARAMGDPSYAQHTLPVREGGASGVLGDKAFWQQLQGGGRVELVVEARNRSQIPVARLGDASAPLVLDVTAEQSAQALAALQPQPLLPAPVPEIAPPPVAAVTPPPSASPSSPPPPQPAGANERSPRWALIATAGGTGALAAFLAVSTLGVMVATAITYAGWWTYPRRVGGDKDPVYIALQSGTVGGVVVGPGLLLLTLAVSSAAGIAAVAWVLLR